MAIVDPQAIEKAIRSVAGPMVGSLHEPDVSESAFEQTLSWYPPIGYRFIEILEAEIAQICNVQHAVAVSSGTAALQLALLALGVQAGDEVILPSLSFVGAANAISHIGAHPHFVDINHVTLGIDQLKLVHHMDTRLTLDRKRNKITDRRIAALISVDLLGHPMKLPDVPFPIIEDAAAALGSSINGKHVGQFAQITIFSFNNNKIVTANGGGVAVTNSKALRDKMWKLATTARIPHAWKMEHSEIAFNYRMGNINAALALSQLYKLSDLVHAKRKLNYAYRDAMRLKGVSAFQVITPGEGSNYWLNSIRVENNRDGILDYLSAKGIACRALFTPMHLLPMYQNCQRSNMTGTDKVWQEMICLPSSPRIML